MKVNRPLKELQTEILFLLIGENPLPNAVTAALLAHPALRIILIHSNGTADIARGFKSWLLKQRVEAASIETISVHDADPASAWKEITSCLENSKPKSVGINYTGGTKLMSVHAHDAVRHWCQSKHIIPVHSYLDARRLRLVIEPAQPETGELSRSVYVGDQVLLTLRELLELHRWALLNEPSQSAVFSQVARQIALLYSKNPDIWLGWKKTELIPKCKVPNHTERFLDDPQLRDVSLSFPDEPDWQDFREAFLETTRLQPGGFTLAQFAAAAGFRKRYPFTEAAKYFDGTWLEHHVMASLLEIRTAALLNDIRQSIETSDVRFELDVAAISGYQLFAFSCGSERRLRWNQAQRKMEEDISNLKLKLFEAYIRATQIGGDEANVVLVSVLEEPGRLERQFSQGLLPPGQNANHPKIKVFGRSDLPNLGQTMLRWINERRGDQMP